VFLGGSQLLLFLLHGHRLGGGNTGRPHEQLCNMRDHVLRLHHRHALLPLLLGLRGLHVRSILLLNSHRTRSSFLDRRKALDSEKVISGATLHTTAAVAASSTAAEFLLEATRAASVAGSIPPLSSAARADSGPAGGPAGDLDAQLLPFATARETQCVLLGLVAQLPLLAADAKKKINLP
jgi:hypothetical protein